MKFTDTGFWISKEGNEYTIGLSEKGQDDLGEVGFVSLATEEALTTESVLLSVEAAKAVSSLPAPLAGNVVRYNMELEDNPEYLNSPEATKNWIAVLTDVNEAEYHALNDESGLAE
ncbi:glycine cleavage system protein H [Jeotgalibaca caeni]|uniref:glycine cleavage system protein H n=1 Tax=Jeotgalibaca caeni TaxID=3028623 RepID=UPI00237E839F|nr:glycine cleavage system protein H [Jeotgalibaca caeni]MDE1548372.1 glycine cleavage system protein H [Jeotgalibaca caeni]